MGEHSADKEMVGAYIPRADKLAFRRAAACAGLSQTDAFREALADWMEAQRLAADQRERDAAARGTP